MDPLSSPHLYNRNINHVLKSFQNHAVRSLSGPTGINVWDPLKPDTTVPLGFPNLQAYMATKKQLTETGPMIKSHTDHGIYPRSGAIVPSQHLQMPLFFSKDSSPSASVKSETILEGDTIACFVVGGEKRLCLPQIFNTVLRDFTWQKINSICDQLHIFCSRCNHEQLNILKQSGILPLSITSCGLITKTDAERLCNALLHSRVEKYDQRNAPPNCFKVYHECFGKCKGLFNPDAYSGPDAKCIQCVDCDGMFCPQKFVCHSHKYLENTTCHWGFDSANWRFYLLLARDQGHVDKLEELLEHIKSKFDHSRKFKRKEHDDEKDSGKRSKLEDRRAPFSDRRASFSDRRSSSADRRASSTDRRTWSESSSGDTRLSSSSAFRPWSPSCPTTLKDYKRLTSLQSGPPVLLNPERVVPHSEEHRYERTFAPNVSLAPASQQTPIKQEMVESPISPADPRASSPTTCYTRNQGDDDVVVTSDTDEASLKSLPSTLSASIENCRSPASSGRDRSSSTASLLRSSTEKPPRSSSVPREWSMEKEMDQLVQMLRDALDGKVSEELDARATFIEQFVASQNAIKTNVKRMEQLNKHLHQELVSLRQLHKDQENKSILQSRSLHNQLDSLILKHRQDIYLLECERNALKEAYTQEVNSTDHGKEVKANYKSSVHEEEIAILRKEVAQLKRELIEVCHADKAISERKLDSKIGHCEHRAGHDEKRKSSHPQKSFVNKNTSESQIVNGHLYSEESSVCDQDDDEDDDQDNSRSGSSTASCTSISESPSLVNGDLHRTDLEVSSMAQQIKSEPASDDESLMTVSSTSCNNTSSSTRRKSSVPLKRKTSDHSETGVLKNCGDSSKGSNIENVTGAFRGQGSSTKLNALVH